MNPSKTSLGVWLTAEEKAIWKRLATMNGMNLSAYTLFVIREVIKEALALSDKQIDLTLITDSEEERKQGLKVRFTKTEIDALDKFAVARGQSRQALIISAVRELLLGYRQIEPKEYELISDSTLSVNRIGVNLNQITRVLNEQNKVGNIDISEIQNILPLIKELGKKIDCHIVLIDKFLSRHKNRNYIKVDVSQKRGKEDASEINKRMAG